MSVRTKPAARDREAHGNEVLELLLDRDQVAGADDAPVTLTIGQVRKASETVGRLLERADTRVEQLQATVADALEELDRATILLRLVIRDLIPSLYREHVVKIAAVDFLEGRPVTALEEDLRARMVGVITSRTKPLTADPLAEAVRAAAEQAVIAYHAAHESPEARLADLPLRAPASRS